MILRLFYALRFFSLNRDFDVEICFAKQVFPRSGTGKTISRDFSELSIGNLCRENYVGGLGRRGKRMGGKRRKRNEKKTPKREKSKEKKGGKIGKKKKVERKVLNGSYLLV